MPGRSKWYRRWRPRSLQARQLLAASLSLVAFLALAGYALDVAFADTAEKNLRERLKNYASAYAANIDFVRDGSLYIGGQPPDPRFDVPGGGLYVEVVRPDESWTSMSAEGPNIPHGRMLEPRQEEFIGPLEMTQIDGSLGQLYRYGLGVSYVEREHGGEIPYTIYVMEDARSMGAQLRVFRGAVWFYLGSAGVVLLVLQASILQWSLRPLRRVINELTKVQRGEIQRMSEQHPRELEPLTDSINAFIESERDNLERQRNTLADLAHSLKTPIAVLRTQLDSGASERDLHEEMDVQLRRMNDLGTGALPAFFGQGRGEGLADQILDRVGVAPATAADGTARGRRGRRRAALGFVRAATGQQGEERGASQRSATWAGDSSG